MKLDILIFFGIFGRCEEEKIIKKEVKRKKERKEEELGNSF